MNKLYELRIYKTLVKAMPEFLALTNEHFHIRTSHSKLIGYFLTELGGANELVHLWEYDNLAHRAKVRGALAADKAWNEKYFSKIKPLLMQQDTMTLQAVHEAPIALPKKEDGFWYHLSIAPSDKGAMGFAVPAERAEILGRFGVKMAGNIGSGITFMRSKDPDSLFASTVPVGAHGRLLTVPPFSKKLDLPWC